jgi:WD40 repeat protein
LEEFHAKAQRDSINRSGYLSKCLLFFYTLFASCVLTFAPLREIFLPICVIRDLNLLLMSLLKRYLFCYYLLCAMPALVQAQQPELISPIGHTDVVRTAKFSASEKYVITGGADRVAIVWETLSGKKLHSFPATKSEIGYAFFSDNDKYIAVGTDSSVVIWSVPGYTNWANSTWQGELIFLLTAKNFL